MMKKIEKLFVIAFVLMLAMVLMGCSENVEYVTDYEIEYIVEDQTYDAKYTGDMVNGAPKGNGELTVYTKSGEVLSVLQGVFSDGSMNGEGSMYTPGIGELKGNFVKGDIKEGETILEDGTKLYEGEYNTYDGITWPEGEGKLFDVEGNVTYEGEFLMGKPTETDKFKAFSKECTYEELISDGFIRLENICFKGTINEIVLDTEDATELIVLLDGKDEQYIYLMYIGRNDITEKKIGDEVVIYGLYGYNETGAGIDNLPVVELVIWE